MNVYQNDMLEAVKINSSIGKSTFIYRREVINLFGFKRVDGLEFALNYLLTGRSEEEQSILPLYETINIFEKWCSDNKIKYAYDLNEDGYLLHYRT